MGSPGEQKFPQLDSRHLSPLRRFSTTDVFQAANLQSQRYAHPQALRESARRCKKERARIQRQTQRQEENARDLPKFHGRLENKDRQEIHSDHKPPGVKSRGETSSFPQNRGERLDSNPHSSL